MEQLLKILEDNARLPIEDIATMLNKSPAEVAAMIDLARAQGIIKGYKTLVDWEKAGVNRVEAVIELNENAYCYCYTKGYTGYRRKLHRRLLVFKR